MARSLTFSLDEPSPLADAVASGRAWSDSVPPSGPLRALLERVGTFSVRSAVVVPVRACRATVAALYADAPDGASLPQIDSFISFVEQAGRSLESAILARRTPQAVSC